MATIKGKFKMSFLNRIGFICILFHINLCKAALGEALVPHNDLYSLSNNREIDLNTASKAIKSFVRTKI